MNPDPKPMGQILVDREVLSQNQVDTILDVQANDERARDMVFGHVVRHMGLATRDQVKSALRHQQRMLAPGRNGRLRGMRNGVQTGYGSIHFANPKSAFSQSFRRLRTALLVRARSMSAEVHEDAVGHGVAVVSSDQGDGRSFTATNLAVSYAMAGKKTLLVDADFRSPSLHKSFDVDNAYGLADVLQNNQSDVILPTDVEGLYLMPTGQVDENANDIVSRDIDGAWLSVARRHFDAVVIDTPPADRFSDAHLIAQWADSVIIVTRRARTRGRKLKSLVNALRKSNANIAGCIVNL